MLIFAGAGLPRAVKFFHPGNLVCPCLASEESTVMANLRALYCATAASKIPEDHHAKESASAQPRNYEFLFQCLLQ
jgi:hypothetical protein